MKYLFWYPDMARSVEWLLWKLIDVVICCLTPAVAVVSYTHHPMIVQLKGKNMATATRKTRTTSGTNIQNHKTIQRVAGYKRVSTDDQADSGLGLSAQDTKIQQQAALKDWSIVCMYEDAGISGTTIKRPDFTRLQDDIRAGNIDAVIVASFDRIGRKTQIVLDFAALCAEHEVMLISVKENFDTSTEQGRFVLVMFAAVAELEADVIRQRTVAALNERGNKFDYKAGMLPMGYVHVVTDSSEYIAIDDNTASVVRSIFDMTRRGKSMGYIAESLNKRKIASRRGSKWYASSVKVILDNKDVYSGKYPSYPAII